MDVRCPSCQVEYELDDARVTSAGVTVKCTSCEHVFKVKPDGVAPPDPIDGEVSTDWVIRQRDGRSFKFKELTTLQKWIVEQKVNRDDEISRTGQSWKPLGEIQELASFFQVVDAANAAQQQASQPPAPQQPTPVTAPSLPSGSIPPGYASPGSLPPGSGPHSPGPPGAVPPGSVPPGSVPPGSVPPGAVPPGSVPPGSVPPGYPQPMPPGYPTPAGFQHVPTNPGAMMPGYQSYPPGQPPMYAPQPTGPYGAVGYPSGEGDALDPSLDEDDPVVAWRRSRQRRRAAVILVLLLIGGAGAAYVAKPDEVRALARRAGLELPALPGRSAPDPAILDGQSALASDRDADLSAAVQRLEPSLRSSPSGAALAIASRLHAAQARHHADRAFLYGLLQDGERAASEEQARATAEGKAYELSGRAQAHDDDQSLSQLAAAEYQALKGAVAEMETNLASVKLNGASSELKREVAVIRALGRSSAARAQAGQSGSRAAFESARTVGDLPPTEIRVAFAGLLVDALPGGPHEQLPAQVDAFLAAHPKHSRATLLKAALEKGLPADPDRQPTDGAKPSGAGDSGEGEDDDNDEKDAKDEKGGAAKASYSSLVRRGERLQRSDRASAALKVFQRASRLEPRRPEAWMGIGWSSIDLERGSSAVSAFKKALAYGGSAEAHFGLGEAYRAQGNSARAADAFRRYLDLRPNGRDAPIARRYLEQQK